MWSECMITDRKPSRALARFPQFYLLRYSILQEARPVSLYLDMNTSEKEERARRVYFKIQEEALGKHSSPKECNTLQRAARYLYYTRCYKVSRESMFYYAAAQIRKDYRAWKQYISDPYKGRPDSLRLVSRRTIFGLALLEKIKSISLEPSTQFFLGKVNKHEILSGDVLCPTDIKDLLTLWDALGRPRMSSWLCETYFIGEAYLAYFEPSARNSYRSLDPDRIKILISESLQFLEEHHYLPITHCCNDMFKFDFEKLVDLVSLSIAFDLREIDTLGAIYELFPNNRDLLPQIIRKYRVSTTSLPEKETVFDELKAEHTKAFGCKINYDNCLSPQTKLHHRGALTLIQNHPQLFQQWRDDPEMKYIYKDLVEPALRVQLFSNMSLRL